jgi:hypothetical protein
MKKMLTVDVYHITIFFTALPVLDGDDKPDASPETGKE